MTVEIVDTPAGMRAIRPAYDEIAASCHAPPFVGWEWIHHWWDAVGAAADVRILTFRDDGEMQGVLPLMVVKHGLKRLGLRELRFASDCVFASPAYLDLVARPGREQDCLDAAFAYITDDDSWDRAEFGRLRAESDTVHLLCRLAAERALRVEVRQNVRCPYIALPDTFNEYLASLTPHRRHHLRTMRSRLSRRFSVSVDLCADPNSVREALDRHVVWKAQRMKAKGKWTPYDDPAYRGFLRRWAEALFEKQWLRLWRLHLDGRLAAIALGVVAGSTCYLKTESRDIAFERENVSHVLRTHCIEHSIEHERLRTFDLLSTEYEHKGYYAKQRQSVLKLTIYRPTLRSLGFEALAHASALPASVLRHLRSRRDLGSSRSKPESGANDATSSERDLNENAQPLSPK